MNFKNLLLWCLITILSFCVKFNAMDTVYEKNTYHGIPLTKENILTIAPQPPIELHKKMILWLETNRKVIEYLLKQKLPLSQARLETNENKEFLNQSDITNWSDYNYVLPISLFEENDYCIQFAGPCIKRGNIAVFNSKSWDCADLKPEEIDSMAIIPTYQTVSRIAYYLRFLEFCEFEKPKFLSTIPTYAIRLPWATTESNDDENIIILQQVIPSVSPETSNDFDFLTNDQLVEFFKMVKYIGYWDKIINNILNIDEIFYIIDFEQPCNSNPQDFFHQNRQKYEWNTICGIQEIAKLINNDEQFEFFKNLVLNDEEVKSFEEFNGLEQFFSAYIPQTLDAQTTIEELKQLMEKYKPHDQYQNLGSDSQEFTKSCMNKSEIENNIENMLFQLYELCSIHNIDLAKLIKTKIKMNVKY